MKNRKLIYIIFAVATAIITSITLNCAEFPYAQSFNDVTKYESAVKLLSELKVIQGYSSTKFAPDDPVTRWQMALLISKIITGEVDSSKWLNIDGEAAFDDVKDSHYLGSIVYANSKGIIIGHSEREFIPEDSISLQDGITMAVRALGYPSADLNIGYPDSYLSIGKELSLFEGISDCKNTDFLTRGQTAQLLYNMIFAKKYNGSTYAIDSFGYFRKKVVLTATEKLRIGIDVGYAKKNKLIFSVLSEYGTMSNSFNLDATRFEFGDGTAEDFIGMAFYVESMLNHSVVISIKQCSEQITSTNAVSVNGDNSTVTIGAVTYKMNNTYTERHIDGISPTKREIIIYSLNDLLTSGSIITASAMEGTNRYYELIAYDDNGDGLADRAFYRPYSFGRYTVDDEDKIAIAANRTADMIDIISKVQVENGDYVLYSFDSQSKTLKIERKFNISTGILNSLSTSEAVINNTIYKIGNDMLPGAHPDAVIKDVSDHAFATPAEKNISYISDGEYILLLKIK